MNENYKLGLMEGHNDDDNNTTHDDYDYYDENIDWDEWNELTRHAHNNKHRRALSRG